jgi:hypothetical protein
MLEQQLKNAPRKVDAIQNVAVVKDTTVNMNSKPLSECKFVEFFCWMLESQFCL